MQATDLAMDLTPSLLLIGKLHISAELTVDSTPASVSRLLTGALMTDCWLSIDGAEAVSLKVWG